MKKWIILFIIVMLVVLGLFFWSLRSGDKEMEESGTLVTAPWERCGNDV